MPTLSIQHFHTHMLTHMLTHMHINMHMHMDMYMMSPVHAGPSKQPPPPPRIVHTEVQPKPGPKRPQLLERMQVGVLRG